jgi:hypothetical protein
MDARASVINVVICITLGGLIAALTPAKWIAASLWVFAALFINGSIAFWEDARPGGFENPDGTHTPAFAKGVGAVKFWAVSLLISLGAIAMGLYVQFAWNS